MNIPTTQYTSMFSTRLSSAYNSLRGDLGAPQTAGDTIGKLVERIQTSAAIEDRRTAVQGLKGLSRDWKEDVGRAAMDSLLAVLQHDAPHDVESAKAAVETLMQLCEVPEKVRQDKDQADEPAKDDLGYIHADAFLSSPAPLHSVLALLSVLSFYPRFYALQFLSLLLTLRPAVAQAHIMAAPPPGVDAILATLDTKSVSTAPGSAGSGLGGGAMEMLRNEGLLLLPVMLAGNADLQKIVAFSGAFERLMEIVDAEAGIDGGIVVQDALTAMGSLLRFNVSNQVGLYAEFADQNYFRELSLIGAIPPILGFPPQLALDMASPDTYCLQYWPEQKIINTGLVLGLVRMLTGGPGGPNQTAMVSSNVTRSLLELALSSNAPSGVKSQILNTLTPILLSSTANQDLLASLNISPLVPIQADEANPNGGFVRDPLRPAVIALVQEVVEGDITTGGRGLRGRAAGVNMFEAFVNGNDDARIDILSTLSDGPAGGIILSGLLDLPSDVDPYRPLFASLLLAHLVRSSEHAKKLARETLIGADDDKVSLVQLVVGNLMMAAREQTECVNRDAKDGPAAGSTEEEDWTRVMVGYLALLCTWLWDSPRTVREFLSESGNLQVVSLKSGTADQLIQPITQPTGSDPLVQGLCAFLLGVCYEFNREPGEITRTTLHPILHSRIGPDQFVSRMARLREDARFKAVQPDAFDDENALEEEDDSLELWFDWAFVDFWKNHYYTIQRSIAIDPDAVRDAGPADDGETTSIIMTLRAKLKTQSEELVQLQSRLSKIEFEHRAETLANEVQALSEQIASLSTQLATTQSTLDERAEELQKAHADVAEERRLRAGSSNLQSTLDSTEKDLATTKTQLESVRASLREAEAKAKEAEERAVEAEGESQRQFVRAQAAEADVAAAAARGSKKKGKAGKGDEDEDAKKVASLEKELEDAKKNAEGADELKVQLEAERKRVQELSEEAGQLETLRGELEAEKKRAEELGKGGEEVQGLKAELEAEKKRVEELVKQVEAAKAAPAASEGDEAAPTSGKAAKKAAKAAEGRVAELQTELDAVKKSKEEGDKEHEDLLVLLEEMSEKRRRDRAKLKGLGESVSDSEGEEDDE